MSSRSLPVNNDSNKFQFEVTHESWKFEFGDLKFEFGNWDAGAKSYTVIKIQQKLLTVTRGD